MSGGEDVAALVAFGLHSVPLVSSVKVFKRKDLSPDFVWASGRGLKCEGPAFAGPFCVYFSILRNDTKLMGRFLCASKCHMLFGLWRFPRVGGLDRICADFAVEIRGFWLRQNDGGGTTADGGGG